MLTSAIKTGADSAYREDHTTVPTNNETNESASFAVASGSVLSSTPSSPGEPTTDLRALQWPPRSPWQVAKNAWLYVKGIVGPLEALFWLSTLYISYQIGGM